MNIKLLFFNEVNENFEYTGVYMFWGGVLQLEGVLQLGGIRYTNILTHFVFSFEAIEE